MLLHSDKDVVGERAILPSSDNANEFFLWGLYRMFVYAVKRLKKYVVPLG